MINDEGWNRGKKGQKQRLISSVPYGYWKIKENQRNFFDSLQKRFDIQSPKEWGRVTVQQVITAGGVTLLDYNQLSLFKALCSIYPGILNDLMS